jgi:hypothetical protein
MKARHDAERVNRVKGSAAADLLDELTMSQARNSRRGES